MTSLKSASPGEVLIAEGGVGLPCVYLIKDGQVEISSARGDVKVLLATLGRGQFFGEDVLVSSGPRQYTARALSYCELQVVEASALLNGMAQSPALVRHMLRSLIGAAQQKDRALAAHEKLQSQPDTLSYAHMLALMAAAAPDLHERHRGEGLVALKLADVVKKCRDITGHSRGHVEAILKRMAMLNLIVLECDSGCLDVAADSLLTEVKVLRFNPRDIAARAQTLIRHNQDGFLRTELELIELADLEALTGVNRSLLLRKLAHGEIAEELFTFRRSEVLRFVTDKGKDYFAKRSKSAELETVEDLLAVDPRTLFTALTSMDEFDLARLLQGRDAAVRQKLLACMSKARRSDVESLMEQELRGDAEDLQRIEESLLDAVRTLRRPAGAPQEPAAVD